jgi:two-component system cell cycle sensor histidine kinase/response regulator CckA
VAAMLELHGYKVLQAARGAAALPLATQHHIHLLISDVVMPQMNGVDLAKRLRLNLPGLKVLFMSGYSESISLPKNTSDENTIFLSKPVPMPTLLEKVRQLLG